MPDIGMIYCIETRSARPAPVGKAGCLGCSCLAEHEAAK